jgi:large subunit ribosomal protein L6
LGELSRSYPDEILLVQEGDEIKVTKRVETRKSRQLHGLCRTLTNNMLEGVSTGWSKKLLLIGVGYRAAVQGNKLTLNLGYSNPVVMEMPPSISATVSKRPSSHPHSIWARSIRVAKAKTPSGKVAERECVSRRWRPTPL